MPNRFRKCVGELVKIREKMPEPTPLPAEEVLRLVIDGRIDEAEAVIADSAAAYMAENVDLLNDSAQVGIDLAREIISA